MKLFAVVLQGAHVRHNQLGLSRSTNTVCSEIQWYVNFPYVPHLSERLIRACFSLRALNSNGETPCRMWWNLGTSLKLFNETQSANSRAGKMRRARLLLYGPFSILIPWTLISCLRAARVGAGTVDQQHVRIYMAFWQEVPTHRVRSQYYTPPPAADECGCNRLAYNLMAACTCDSHQVWVCVRPF